MPGVGAGGFGAGLGGAGSGASDTSAASEGLGAVGTPSPEEHPRSANVVRIGKANFTPASYSADGAARIKVVIRTNRQSWHTAVSSVNLENHEFVVRDDEHTPFDRRMGLIRLRGRFDYAA